MLHANVVDGVHRIADSFTNWYLLEDDRRLTVVDAGVPQARTVLVGHGEPWTDGVESAVARAREAGAA
jgi:hypothetical protein